MKKVLLAGFGLIAVAGSAMGEGVTATKKSPVMTPIENLYGRLEVRQTSKSDVDRTNKRQNRVSAYTLVPRIGTKAYSNRLDAYVEPRLVSSAQSSTFEQGKSFYQATFAALEGDHFTITPYVNGYLPYKNERLSSTLNLNFDAASSVDTGFGLLTFHAAIEPELATGTKVTKVDANVTSNGALSLDDTGAPKTKSVAPQEPTSTLEYVAGFAFVPSMAPKFSIGADTYVDREFAPVYEVREDAAGSHQEKTGYSISDKTTTDIVVVYKADSLTSIQSLTRVRQDGVLAKVPAIEQRLSLIQKLF
jgi:hypothetical protein